MKSWISPSAQVLAFGSVRCTVHIWVCIRASCQPLCWVRILLGDLWTQWLLHWSVLHPKQVHHQWPTPTFSPCLSGLQPSRITASLFAYVCINYGSIWHILQNLRQFYGLAHIPNSGCAVFFSSLLFAYFLLHHSLLCRLFVLYPRSRSFVSLSSAYSPFLCKLFQFLFSLFFFPSPKAVHAELEFVAQHPALRLQPLLY